MDIHPAAKIGCGILLDHATSFVAGETAEIEDDVSILHEVTLGGTGKERGDRHPKINSGVLLARGPATPSLYLSIIYCGYRRLSTIFSKPPKVVPAPQL